MRDMVGKEVKYILRYGGRNDKERRAVQNAEMADSWYCIEPFY